MSDSAQTQETAQSQFLPGPTQVKYPMTAEKWARLDRDFTYHAPHTDQPQRYLAVREAARTFALGIHTSTPPSDEQEQALHYLGLAVFLANAAIARHE